MAGGAGLRAGVRGRGSRVLPAGRGGHRGAAEGRGGPVQRDHAVPEHDPAGFAGPVEPARAGHGSPDPVAGPVERAGDGAAGERGVLRAGRSYRQLPVRGDPVRRGLPAFLPRRVRRPRRRPAVHPGAFVAWHLRPVVRGGSADRGSADEIPDGDRRRRPVVVSASVADAGVLADADGVDGPGPDHGDLPGAVPEVPGLPRAGRHRGPQGLGVPGRRGDRRAGVAGRHRHGEPGEAGQPYLRGQLQPAAAGRPGPRQRQDHPGAGGHLPRRGLERDQGDLGQRLGPAYRPRFHRPAAEADGGGGRRRVPGLQVQERRVRPGEVLRHVPGAGRDGGRDDR